MFYSFDIDVITRRFVPAWFRASVFNMALSRVATSGVAAVHAALQPVRDAIEAEYRYNGLEHSLEAMLNDRWDAVERRIYIHTPNQEPTLFLEDDADPPVAWLELEEDLSPYYCESESQGELYDFEFLVMVPNTIMFDAQAMLAAVNLYRFAGRRPAIKLFDPLTGIILPEVTTPPQLENG